MHNRYKHGFAPLKGKRKPVYVAWQSMHNRCYRKGNRNYKHYGARGIRVCERWSGDNGFLNFLADMGDPDPGMSVERIDNNADYIPSNCRWIPRGDQSKNRRHNWMVSLGGVTMTAREATRRLNLNPSSLDRKLRLRGYSKETVIPVEILL